MFAVCTEIKLRVFGKFEKVLTITQLQTYISFSSVYLSFMEVNIQLIREGGTTTSRMKSWIGIMRLTVAKIYFRFYFQWRARFASSSNFLHVFNSDRDRTVLSSRAVFHRYYQSET